MVYVDSRWDPAKILAGRYPFLSGVCLLYPVGQGSQGNPEDRNGQ